MSSTSIVQTKATTASLPSALPGGATIVPSMPVLAVGPGGDQGGSRRALPQSALNLPPQHALVEALGPVAVGRVDLEVDHSAHAPTLRLCAPTHATGVASVRGTGII